MYPLALTLFLSLAHGQTPDKNDDASKITKLPDFFKDLGMDPEKKPELAKALAEKSGDLNSFLRFIPPDYWENVALPRNSGNSLQPQTETDPKNSKNNLRLPRAIGFRFTHDPHDDSITDAIAISFNHANAPEGSHEIEIMKKKKGEPWQFYSVRFAPTLQVTQNERSDDGRTCLSCHGIFDPSTKKKISAALPILRDADFSQEDAAKFCEFALNDSRYKVLFPTPQDRKKGPCEDFIASFTKQYTGAELADPIGKGGILAKTLSLHKINASLAELDKEIWDKRVKTFNEFFDKKTSIPEIEKAPSH